jgi:hypothetical protein
VCISFTATGAIWGLLAILAIFEEDYRMMIVWMIVAMLVDGFDGALARWADVKKYANGVDGALLDNILDYLNYVLVPVIFIVKTDYLPACQILHRLSDPADLGLSIHADRCQDRRPSLQGLPVLLERGRAVHAADEPAAVGQLSAF